MATAERERREYFCVFQKRYPIEPSEFSTSLPLLRTSDGDYGGHTRPIQRQCGTEQSGGHHPWLRAVRYDTHAHCAAARRRWPGDSTWGL